jgi:hypothetical protein
MWVGVRATKGEESKEWGASYNGTAQNEIMFGWGRRGSQREARGASKSSGARRNVRREEG